MVWLIVTGVRPYDGRYEFDLGDRDFTTREWGWVKRLSGYLPLTVTEGFDNGDPELFCAFAVIALYRAGRVEARDVPEVYERFADAPSTSTVRLESDDSDADDDDPFAASIPESSRGSTPIFGDGSRRNSATSDDGRPPIGTPGSDTSESVPARSRT